MKTINQGFSNSEEVPPGVEGGRELGLQIDKVLEYYMSIIRNAPFGFFIYKKKNNAKEKGDDILTCGEKGAEGRKGWETLQWTEHSKDKVSGNTKARMNLSASAINHELILQQRVRSRQSPHDTGSNTSVSWCKESDLCFNSRLWRGKSDEAVGV